jgi:hypothetical protein
LGEGRIAAISSLAHTAGEIPQPAQPHGKPSAHARYITPNPQVTV